jgi:hypothetical protein
MPACGRLIASLRIALAIRTFVEQKACAIVLNGVIALAQNGTTRTSGDCAYGLPITNAGDNHDF